MGAQILRAIHASVKVKSTILLMCPFALDDLLWVVITLQTNHLFLRARRSNIFGASLNNCVWDFTLFFGAEDPGFET